MFLGPESYIEKKKNFKQYFTILAYSRKLGNRRSSEGLQNVKPPQKRTSLLTLIILAGDIKINQGPMFLCRLCKKYCNATDKFVTCNDCEKRFYATCANPVQYDKCEMWVHNKGSLVSETQYENIQNSNCSWICPKCVFFNFSDSFFSDKLNLEEQNRFAPCQTIVAVVLKLVNRE